MGRKGEEADIEVKHMFKSKAKWSSSSWNQGSLNSETYAVSSMHTSAKSKTKIEKYNYSNHLSPFQWYLVSLSALPTAAERILWVALLSIWHVELVHSQQQVSQTPAHQQGQELHFQPRFTHLSSLYLQLPQFENLRNQLRYIEITFIKAAWDY